MVATNYGKSGLALLLAGSANPARYLELGNGSAANDVTLGSLVSPSGSLRTDFTSRDIATAQEVTYTFDVSAVAMSGLVMSEFGIGGSQAIGTNDLWAREGFTGITFDGSNELQIQITFQTY